MGISPKISSPPKDLKAYADTLDELITRYGEYFEYIELWNEPNNKSEWDFTLDPNWEKFSDMIIKAAFWARHRGKKTVLGGMSPVDASWLELMFMNGVMDHIDVVGIHGFPDVFDSHWEGWEENIARVRQVLNKYNFKGKIWITETGFSTWQFDEVKQVKVFTELLDVKYIDRVYWYTLHDLDLEMATVDGFHIDEREYHFGLKSFNGTPKLLFRLWKNQGIDAIKPGLELLQNKVKVRNGQKPALITGGAGFVGTNFADALLSEGKPVIIYDNLSRDGVESNLAWLCEKHKGKVDVRIADIRNPYEVKRAVEDCCEIYHFAAQVAVTTSVANPMDDFAINIQGTLNVLEALRKMDNPPPLIYTSTNKVYGDLNDIELAVNDTRYLPTNEKYKNGVSEDRPLSFHSPYGCSKGAADQYVLDYARIYNLQATVFRMSCIYGPHQYGNEDQGWVAHCLLSAMEDKTITIYGDGKQVRDILFVDDLVEALKLARKNIHKLSAKAYNIGGSSVNSVSLLEVMNLMEKVLDRKIDYKFSDWRPGDQRYYVSNTNSFSEATGWSQKVNYRQGMDFLYNWIIESRGLEVRKELVQSEI